jgi:histidine triad (HIT) family protein
LTADSCAFCKIVRGEAQADILHRDDTVLAFRDIRSAAPTHILIIPTKHLSGMQDMDSDDAALFGHMVSVARDLARSEGVDSSGYRLVINTGWDAGQSVFHLHIHLLGGRRLRWPPG